MKKMMIIAAALMVVGVSQAAVVLWGTGASITCPQITGTSGVALPETSWAAIIKYTGVFSVEGGAGTAPVTGYSATSMTVMQAVNFGDGVAMGSVKPGRFAAQFDDSSLAIGDLYAIVVFENGTKTSDTTFGTAIDSGKYDVWTFTVDNETGEDFRWMASESLDLEAVPEPTSLALLAIGAAAFGLRRKVRK